MPESLSPVPHLICRRPIGTLIIISNFEPTKESPLFVFGEARTQTAAEDKWVKQSGLGIKSGQLANYNGKGKTKQNLPIDNQITTRL